MKQTPISLKFVGLLRPGLSLTAVPITPSAVFLLFRLELVGGRPILITRTFTVLPATFDVLNKSPVALV